VRGPLRESEPAEPPLTPTLSPASGERENSECVAHLLSAPAKRGGDRARERAVEGVRSLASLAALFDEAAPKAPSAAPVGAGASPASRGRKAIGSIGPKFRPEFCGIFATSRQEMRVAPASCLFAKLLIKNDKLRNAGNRRRSNFGRNAVKID